MSVWDRQDRSAGDGACNRARQPKLDYPGHGTEGENSLRMSSGFHVSCGISGDTNTQINVKTKENLPVSNFETRVQVSGNLLPAEHYVW